MKKTTYDIRGRQAYERQRANGTSTNPNFSNISNFVPLLSFLPNAFNLLYASS
jgi:hypothetical protein